MEYSLKQTLTKIGELNLIACNEKLCMILFADQEIPEKIKSNLTKDTQDILLEVEKQLQEYFTGDRIEFNLPIDLRGTEFQTKVWNALLKIPYGKTISYQELAEMTGSSRKARAVGSANARNPLPIIIPCHRVINKNGKLGGYAGGMELKKQLLKLEKDN